MKELVWTRRNVRRSLARWRTAERRKIGENLLGNRHGSTGDPFCVDKVLRSAHFFEAILLTTLLESGKVTIDSSGLQPTFGSAIKIVGTIPKIMKFGIFSEFIVSGLI